VELPVKDEGKGERHRMKHLREVQRPLQETIAPAFLFVLYFWGALHSWHHRMER